VTKTLKEKTLKREFAFLMFVHLVWLSVLGDSSLIDVFIWPYILFIGGAYGLDSFKKDGIPSITPSNSVRVLGSGSSEQSVGGTSSEYERTGGSRQPADTRSNEQPTPV
jgi:hypothetical protein